jgi:hypothetical protein
MMQGGWEAASIRQHNEAALMPERSIGCIVQAFTNALANLLERYLIYTSTNHAWGMTLSRDAEAQDFVEQYAPRVEAAFDIVVASCIAARD